MTLSENSQGRNASKMLNCPTTRNARAASRKERMREVNGSFYKDGFITHWWLGLAPACWENTADSGLYTQRNET